MLIVQRTPYTTTVAPGTVTNVKSAPFNAVGNGIAADDLPAFSAALATLASGDTLLVPEGTYNLVLNGNALTIPAGVTILGREARTILKLTTNDGNAYRELFRPGGSHVTLEGLTIQRSADFPLVMLPIMGSSNPKYFTIRNCTIAGNYDVYPTNYCHAIQVGNNAVSDILIQGTTIKTCRFGLFQASNSTGTVNGITVQNCVSVSPSASCGVPGKC